MTPRNPLLTLLLGAACLAGLPAAIQAADAPAPAPAAQPSAPPSPAAVVNMVNNCFSCHGTDGRSPGSIPSLTGLTPKVVAETLKEFKSGDRPATVMNRHAKGYTDAEIEALANYIGANLK